MRSRDELLKEVEESRELIREQQQEIKKLRGWIGEAAREINCAGPVAHRIRILKREHQSELETMERRISDLELMIRAKTTMPDEREPVVGDDGGTYVSFSEPCTTR